MSSVGVTLTATATSAQCQGRRRRGAAQWAPKWLATTRYNAAAASATLGDIRVVKGSVLFRFGLVWLF